MSGKKRVRHNPQQIVEKLQEADRLLNAAQLLGQVLHALLDPRGDLGLEHLGQQRPAPLGGSPPPPESVVGAAGEILSKAVDEV